MLSWKTLSPKGAVVRVSVNGVLSITPKKNRLDDAKSGGTVASVWSRLPVLSVALKPPAALFPKSMPKPAIG
jgi:hypothetical protein